MAWWYRETPNWVGAQEGEPAGQLHQARSSKGCYAGASGSPAWVPPPRPQLPHPAAGYRQELGKEASATSPGEREGEAGDEDGEGTWAVKLGPEGHGRNVGCCFRDGLQPWEERFTAGLAHKKDSGWGLTDHRLTGC